MIFQRNSATPISLVSPISSFLAWTLALSLFIAEPSWAVERLKFAGDVALSLPQPLVVGLEAQCEGDERFCSQKLRSYLHLGYFQWPLVAQPTRQLSEFSTELGARYSFHGTGFFVSGGLGYRTIRYSADMSKFNIDGEVLATRATLGLNTFYFNPMVGWSFQVGKNAFLSVELGVQLPLISSGSLFMENEETGDNSDNNETLQTDSRIALGRLARFILPEITLVRFTWYLD